MSYDTTIVNGIYQLLLDGGVFYDPETDPTPGVTTGYTYWTPDVTGTPTVTVTPYPVSDNTLSGDSVLGVQVSFRAPQTGLNTVSVGAEQTFNLLQEWGGDLGGVWVYHIVRTSSTSYTLDNYQTVNRSDNYAVTYHHPTMNRNRT